MFLSTLFSFYYLESRKHLGSDRWDLDAKPSDRCVWRRLAKHTPVSIVARVTNAFCNQFIPVFDTQAC
jgi:hypothetical protein